LTESHAGGTYHPEDKSIHISMAALNSPRAGPFDPGNMIFVLGHELQHGFNAATIKQAETTCGTALQTIAKSHGLRHDYTPAIAGLLAANRRDEAGAEIAGWNAVVSAVKAEKPHPTLEDIYRKAPSRMADFINTRHTPYTLKPNLSLNDDLTLSPTHAGVDNVEGIGQNYFDQQLTSPYGLGHYGDSDYANFYGASAVGWAVAMERTYNPPGPGGETPRMAVNLAQLHLDRQQLERDGLDLGQNHQPMPFYDLSQTPPRLDHFHHTAQTHVYEPVTQDQPQHAAPEQQHASPGDDSPRAGQAGSALRLDPDLQRIFNAGLSGDGAKIDAAFEQCTSNYLNTAQGLAFNAEARVAARLPEETLDKVTAHNVLPEAKPNHINNPQQTAHEEPDMGWSR